MSKWRATKLRSIYEIKCSVFTYSSFLVVGMLAIALPQMDYFNAVPGDLGDARFNSVILEHLYLWAKGIEPHLWSPGFYYPFQGALTFSDNHFGSGWIYVALRILGISREEAFNGWYLTSFGLNFAACAYTLRRFGYSPLASSVRNLPFDLQYLWQYRNGGHSLRTKMQHR